MNFNKSKSTFTIMIALLIAIAFSIFGNPNSTMASGVGGTGGGSTTLGGVGWTHASGPDSDGKVSAAWRLFEKANSNRNLKETFLVKSQYSVQPMNGMSRQAFYDACRTSQFIWWYGDKSNFYTQIGANVHPKKEDMPHSSKYGITSRMILDVFMGMPNNGWNRHGGTVVICSRSFAYEPVAPVIPITLTADSKTFIHDGKKKTVNTFKYDKGKLQKGDVLTATASGSATAVGNHNGVVKFTKKAVIKNGNKDVSDKYKVTHKNGNIKILGKPSGPSTKCDVTSTQKAKTVVTNDLSLTQGFNPGDSPKIESSLHKKNNKAHNLQSTAGLPKVKSSKKTWDNWKAEFEKAGKDLSTKELNIEPIAATLMKHGGILNVTRSHHEVEVSADLCQPKKRELSISGDKVVTKWVNDGGLRIDSISKKNTGSKQFSYQIIGVNCNLEGFNKVKSDFGGKDLSYKDGTASGLFQTNEKSGTNFSLGIRSHYTGKDIFYNADGETSDGLGNKWKNSCKETFKDVCISDKLGSNAKNDANNNLNKEPSFTKKDSEGVHSYPSENGELNFFRDNKDREVRANVWYPGPTGKGDLVTFPNEAAKRTTLKLIGGTPEIDVTTIAPWNHKSSKLEEVDQEKEWGENINSFTMKSQWASEKDKPYEAAIDWAYDAEAKNVGPAKIDGYKVLSKTSVKSYKFESHCTFRNDIGKYPAEIPDNPFTSGSGWTEPNWDNAGTIKALFTRSVSDKVTDTTREDSIKE